MTTSATPVVKYRIESIDIVRGLVMLIMAIDHTRDLFNLGHPEPTDLAVTTPILFFTRFITHFCAPTFVFLSGISAYLAGTRRTKGELGAFLVKRGLWLLVIEFVFITFAITFDPGYHLFIFQVIWAIGGSMVLLGLLLLCRASLPVIGVIGLIIFFGHNLFDPHGVLGSVNETTLGKSIYWRMLISAGGFSAVWPLGGGRILLIAYALLPWAGVMMVGYAFGSLYKSSVDSLKRRRTLLYTGLFLLALFVLIRYFNLYGDPAPWAQQKTTAYSIISFFNVTKYPPSLMYLCITLGVSITLLSFVEKVKNRFTSLLIVYGNVPMFYYLCHWYLLRLLCIVTIFAQGFQLKDFSNPDTTPLTYGFPLWGVYLMWLAVVIILYYPCRWYGRYKKTHTQWWLSYL